MDVAQLAHAINGIAWSQYLSIH